jgi:transposase InsO family protein
MPWIVNRYRINQAVQRQLLSISARQIDRRMKNRKAGLRKRIYGRTKPGTLLKHHFPIRTDNWDVKTPGWTEVDTVSHSGNCAEGTFCYTVNQTDILTGWVESQTVLGKAEDGVVNALSEMARAFPFKIKGLDSDNGSEFINWHVYRYCKKNKIQPFRGRPYKKDDNAHIEQKNWTHVRKLLGWDRYDTQKAVEAINDLYRNEMHLFMNLFMPSMKLLTKERVGSNSF